MRTPKNTEKTILVISIIMIIASACNQPYSQGPSVTNTPINPTSLFATPVVQTPDITMSDIANFGTSTALAAQSTQAWPPPVYFPPTIDPEVIATGTALVVQSVENTIYSELQAVDKSLNQSMKSNIAYSSPKGMKLSDTVTVVLYINPSKTPEQLAAEVIEDQPEILPDQAQVVTASVEITDRMKAELIADDKDAFTVQAIPTNPEQLISTIDTTRWAWLLTAHKSGPQKLTLVIYRLVKYSGLEYWREVETYKAAIEVKVTLGQRIESLDWKWILGIILTALVIPAFWRWMDGRRKQSEPNQTPKLQKKKTR